MITNNKNVLLIALCGHSANIHYLLQKKNALTVPFDRRPMLVVSKTAASAILHLKNKFQHKSNTTAHIPPVQ